MSLVLQLLGAPVLLADGVQMPLRRRKAMALLAYLCVTKTRHPRDTLAALLWPEVDPSSAYPALRNALWALRQTPLSDLIRSDRTTVELVDGERLIVDVNHFRRLMSACPSGSHCPLDVCQECEPRLKEAIGLYQGPFLSGFSAGESIRFDDWQFAESRALHRELIEALDRITDYYSLCKDWAAVCQYARMWLREDSANELAYRKLMCALATQGKRAEALQAFSDCEQILRREMNLSPEQSTCQLAEKIRNPRGGVRSGERNSLRRPPYPRSPIIGRREIVTRIEEFLLGDSAQVLTLVGMGGIGKTSLALHVGRNIEDWFCDGVAFVPLDVASVGVSIVPAITSAIGIANEHSGAIALDQLSDYLRNRRMLLILDGAERHLPQVASLLLALGSTPSMRVLVTSQIAMGSADEVVIPVPGLTCPDRDTSTEHLGDYPAMRLLEAAAKRHGTLLQLDDTELNAMARLTRLLSGLPLGLEMAAGWRSMMSWDEIADQVSNNLEFLVHAQVVIEPKHRTLGAVFEQSWELLPSDAQRALRGLSVFRCGFTMTAASSVTGCNPSSLATLVSRRLLARLRSDRFEMHQLLRHFASAKLSESQREAKRAAYRHSLHYTDAVSQWCDGLKGPRQRHTLAQMGDEIGNIQQAFQTAAEIGDSEQLRSACLGLCIYYNRRTLFAEAERFFADACQAYQVHADRDSSVDGFLRVSAGCFASLDDPDLGARRAAEGLKVFTASEIQDELHAMANLLYAYATFNKHGSYEYSSENRTRIEKSLSFYRERGDVWGQAVAMGLAAAVEIGHDNDRADQFAQQRLRLCRELKDEFGEGLALHQLARLAETRGDLECALTWYEEVQRRYEPFTRGSFGVVNSMLDQVRVERALGHVPRSIQLAEDALSLSREAGYRSLVGRTLFELAQSIRAVGDRAVAKAHLEEAFALVDQRNLRALQVECAKMLLDLALEEMNPLAADRWLQEVAMLGHDSEELRLQSDKLDILRIQLRERETGDGHESVPRN